MFPSRPTFLKPECTMLGKFLPPGKNDKSLNEKLPSSLSPNFHKTKIEQSISRVDKFKTKLLQKGIILLMIASKLF